MLGRLITIRLLSSKNGMKKLPLKLIIENDKIKDIKILPELVGKELTNVKHFSETYYLNSSIIQEQIQKDLNKNVPLL